jgi:hypothetical protein
VRRAGLPGRRLAKQTVGVPLCIVEHVEAHLLEVGSARRQKRSAPTTPRGSKTAQADFLIILFSLCPKISAQSANGRLFAAAAHLWTCTLTESGRGQGRRRRRRGREAPALSPAEHRATPHLHSCSPARPRRTPPAQLTVSQSGSLLGGRGGDDALGKPPDRRCRDRSKRRRCFSRSALTALPPPKPSVPSRG